MINVVPSPQPAPMSGPDKAAVARLHAGRAETLPLPVSLQVEMEAHPLAGKYPGALAALDWAALYPRAGYAFSWGAIREYNSRKGEERYTRWLIDLHAPLANHMQRGGTLCEISNLIVSSLQDCLSPALAEYTSILAGDKLAVAEVRALKDYEPYARQWLAQTGIGTCVAPAVLWLAAEPGGPTSLRQLRPLLLDAKPGEDSPSVLPAPLTTSDLRTASGRSLVRACQLPYATMIETTTVNEYGGVDSFSWCLVPRPYEHQLLNDATDHLWRARRWLSLAWPPALTHVRAGEVLLFGASGNRALECRSWLDKTFLGNALPAAIRLLPQAAAEGDGPRSATLNESACA